MQRLLCNLAQHAISHQEKPETRIIRKFQIRVKVHLQNCLGKFEKLVTPCIPGGFDKNSRSCSEIESVV